MYKRQVEELFTQLMTMSRRYQYSLLCARKKTPPLGFTEVEEIRKRDVRVVFQGVEGAYSHAAVRMYFGEDADAYHVEKFEDTIRELERGQADYAVLPIENSTACLLYTSRIFPFMWLRAAPAWESAQLSIRLRTLVWWREP